MFIWVLVAAAMQRFLLLLAVFVLLALAKQSHHHKRREVLLQQGRTLDTRSAVRASQDKRHKTVAASMDESTEHQYIVHVAGPITDAKKSAIESAAHVKLLHYIPHNSFLVTARSDQLAALEAAPGVLWVGAFHPEYKMPQQVLDWEHNKLEGASSTDMFVMLHSKMSTHALRSKLAGWAHELKRETGISAKFIFVRNSKFQVQVKDISQFSTTALWLAERPLVHWIEPTFTYQQHAYAGGTGLIESNSTEHASLLAAAGTRTSCSHQCSSSAGFTGGPLTTPIPVAGEVIAVGDSGIDYQSCFFDGPGATAPPDGTTAPDTSRKVIKYVTTYADGVDFTGHGTAVSGAIAGNTNLPGFSDYNGLTPDAKLYVIDLGLGPGIVRACVPPKLSSPS